ncbi:MAG: ATP-binding protein [Candidatus Pacebacteria bacterium]|nr:ATP-binding protein [Candidatus Paceibacterota bacterium]
MNSRKFLLNRLFFTISLLFSFWTVFDLIEWTNIHSDFILFIWDFQGLILGLLAIFCVYFIYVFLDKKDVSARIKVIFLSLLAPIFILTPTSFNLSGFDITSCDAFKFSWLPFEFYYIALGVLAMVWIFVLLIRRYHTAVSDSKKQIVLMGTGIELFLFIFFIWTSLTYYLTELGILPDSRLEFYGMFGMVIFIIYISILIVRFKAFNGKLFATQALVWALVILIGSEFFFTQNTLNIVLIAITLAVSAGLGLSIIRSVKKEIEQKEQLAALNINLQSLMKQRESLMHLITHKVKGSFTRTKIIFASILDGTFGEISPEIKKRAAQGLDFDNGGIQTVDLILNVANMQNGIIKYERKPVNFKELVEQVVSEKKIQIEAKGLKLETNIQDGTFNVTGDVIWLKESINNLIENSFRYTKEGKITVGLEKKDNKILFSVKDTGVGITDDDKKNLFTEGGRGANSVKVNVDSTGYGLYTVRLVVEAHKGRVWGESEGPGKGAQFYVELPVA